MSFENPGDWGVIRRIRKRRGGARSGRIYVEHWIILLIVGGTIARALYLVFR